MKGYEVTMRLDDVLFDKDAPLLRFGRRGWRVLPDGDSPTKYAVERLHPVYPLSVPVAARHLPYILKGTVES